MVYLLTYLLTRSPRSTGSLVVVIRLPTAIAYSADWRAELITGYSTARHGLTGRNLGHCP